MSRQAQQSDCEAIGKQREELANAGRPAATADRIDVTDLLRDGPHG